MTNDIVHENRPSRRGIEEGVPVHWLVQRTNIPEGPIRTLYRRMELGDVLLFVYLLALIRQYSWPISNNVLAWVLSFSVALSLWCLGLSKKGEPSPREGLSYSFYLIVALPLFVIYAIRFVFPDVSWDVLTYHISTAERTLKGYPSLLDPPLNPVPDMVTGIYRHILGYRAGTIVNYLTLIWVATILVKFLRAFLKRTWLIFLAVLLIVLTETLLFEINNYMVDLLALPLLLQATYSILYVKGPRTIGYSQFYSAFLLGLSVAFKLTNIIFVIPIVLVWAHRVLTGKFRLAPVPLLFLLFGFSAPLIPHAAHLYRETGSPLFVPVYSDYIKSPSAFKNLPSAFSKLKDLRWGPIGLKQMLLWPALLYSKAERLSERPGYAGRIPLGFVLAFLFLPFKRVDNRIRALSFIMILGALLWSFTTGYTRYASYLELVSGLLIIYLFRFFADNMNIRDSLKRVLLIFPFGVLTVLSLFSLYFVSYSEWSERPTLFNGYRAYLRDARLIFRDYSLKSFLPPERSALFDDVEVWIRGAPLTGWVGGLMKPDITTIDLGAVGAFDNASNKRMFAFCHLKDIEPTVDAITQRGLGVWKITIVGIPYYSYNTMVYSLALIEVRPTTAKGLQIGNLLFSSADGPLPAAAFQASIASQSIPTSLKRGSKATVYFTVKNISTVIWPMLGMNGETLKVNLGNHWLDNNGRVLINDDTRTGLAFDLRPGDEVELPLTITTPRAPAYYILEIDMVQEGVAWFGRMGSKTLRAYISVE